MNILKFASPVATTPLPVGHRTSFANHFRSLRDLPDLAPGSAHRGFPAHHLVPSPAVARALNGQGRLPGRSNCKGPARATVCSHSSTKDEATGAQSSNHVEILESGTGQKNR